MRSSLSFPNWAKPSYLSSQPSRAKVEHFNFWAETKLKTKNGNFKSECTTERSLNAGLDNFDLHEKLLTCSWHIFMNSESTNPQQMFCFPLEEMRTIFLKINSFRNILISIEKFYLPIFVWARLEGVPAATGTPKLVKWVVAVSVLGPAITKLVQSNRNWQMFSFSLQILVSHLPVSWGASVGLKGHSIYMYMDKKCRIDCLKSWIYCFYVLCTVSIKRTIAKKKCCLKG